MVSKTPFIKDSEVIELRKVACHLRYNILGLQILEIMIRKLPILSLLERGYRTL
jgi:hypothetical protein